MGVEQEVVAGEVCIVSGGTSWEGVKNRDIM